MAHGMLQVKVVVGVLAMDDAGVSGASGATCHTGGVGPAQTEEIRDR